MTFTFNPDGVIDGGNEADNDSTDNIKDVSETTTQDKSGLVQCPDGYYQFESQCYSCSYAAYWGDYESCDATGLKCKNGSYTYRGHCMNSSYGNCDDLLQYGNGYCNPDGSYSCNSGYYKNPFGGCSNCPQHASCTNSVIQCDAGYVNTGDNCRTSCQSDASEINGICVCNSGYYMDQGTCDKCPDNSTCNKDGFICNPGYTHGGPGCEYCYGEIVNGKCIMSETGTQPETTTYPETTGPH